MFRRLLCAAALGAPLSVGWAQDFSLTAQGFPDVRWQGGAFVVEGMGESGVFDTRRARVLEGPQKEAFLAKEDGEAVTLTPSRTSPDGKSKAVVVVNAAAAGGAWVGDQFRPAGITSAELRVERDGRAMVSRNWLHGVLEATTLWSPDGRYVAWVLTTSDWSGMDGSRSFQVVVGPGRGTRTQVLAAAEVLAKGSPKLLDAVEKAGLTLAFVGPAKKARPRSVVYAAKGFEADAQRLAALVPGGATVEPMSWASGADVVLAGGSSVLGGGR